MSVLRAMIELGKALGIDVVAEGVEEPAQMDALRDPGCDLAQGYLVSPPLRPSEIPSFVDRRVDVVAAAIGNGPATAVGDGAPDA